MNGFHVRPEHLRAAARVGARRAGGRGRRRWWDRDGLPRVQGRDRDGVAGDRRRRSAASRSAPSSRRTTASATGCGWTASRSASEIGDRRGPEPVRREPRPALPRPAARLGLDHRRRRHRRAAAPPPVRAARPAGRPGHRPRRAAPAATPAATCSSRSRPATACRPTTEDDPRSAGLRRPGRRRQRHRRRCSTAAIEATEEAIVNALVAADDDGRARRDHRPRPAPRPAGRDRWPATAGARQPG